MNPIRFVFQMEMEKIAFLPEFSEFEFLNEIANYPCLYHHLDPDYKNNKKEECWTQIGIGEMLNCEGYSKQSISIL